MTNKKLAKGECAVMNCTLVSQLLILWAMKTFVVYERNGVAHANHFLITYAKKIFPDPCSLHSSEVSLSI